jgi:integrase
MQNGVIVKKNGAWWCYYNVREQRDGKVTWAKRAKRLAPASGEYRTEASVRHLAAEVLAPLNTRQARPEPTQTVATFIENVYLPHVKATLRPSTHFGYQFLFRMLKPHLGDLRLRDFGAVEGEQVLADFAAEKRRAQTMLKNAKGFLSGAFRFAVRSGVLKANPMRETITPKGGKAMDSGRAYTLAEIKAMLKVLPEPSRTAVLIAALTGLRRSEIRGLKWEDFTGEELHVKRSVWGVHVGETKTVASGASVPVLPVLRRALEKHHKRSTGSYIFAGGTGKPLQLGNITRRDIVPALEKAKIEWEGWHGFRRGLATTLYELGVPDKVIQAILRHANVAVTMKHYVQTSNAQAQAAMDQLEEAFGRAVTKQVTKTRTRKQI